jgi:hypothetical protein
VELAVWRTVLSLALLGLVAVLASDTVSGRFTARPGVAVDPAGRISAEVPDGWRAAAGKWGLPPVGRGGRGPALVLSPDPARWAGDPAMPGAFIGLSAQSQTATTPAELIAERRQVACTAAPVRTIRPGGVQWLIAGYRSCPDGRAQIVDAVRSRPGGAGLVYVQIAPPPDSAPGFVDTLLAGVRVR